MKTTKLFQHYCDNCVYIFTTHGEVDYDWYVCPQQSADNPSVIARYSDEGSSYWSCPANMVRSNKYAASSHYGSDRISISPMNLMANMVLDCYEKEMEMKIKTSQLTGSALDWAVAKCESLYLGTDLFGLAPIIAAPIFVRNYKPSTDWAQGGPIIEREFIRIQPESPYWEADTYTDAGDCFTGVGPTPLIAACRCYVASKLGGEVEIPDELA